MSDINVENRYVHHTPKVLASRYPVPPEKPKTAILLNKDHPVYSRESMYSHKALQANPATTQPTGIVPKNSANIQQVQNNILNTNTENLFQRPDSSTENRQKVEDKKITEIAKLEYLSEQARKDDYFQQFIYGLYTNNTVEPKFGSIQPRDLYEEIPLSTGKKCSVANIMNDGYGILTADERQEFIKAFGTYPEDKKTPEQKSRDKILQNVNRAMNVAGIVSAVVGFVLLINFVVPGGFLGAAALPIGIILGVFGMVTLTKTVISKIKAIRRVSKDREQVTKNKQLDLQKFKDSHNINVKDLSNKVNKTLENKVENLNTDTVEEISRQIVADGSVNVSSRTQNQQNQQQDLAHLKVNTQIKVDNNKLSSNERSYPNSEDSSSWKNKVQKNTNNKESHLKRFDGKEEKYARASLIKKPVSSAIKREQDREIERENTDQAIKS